jgi:hypothetical protein
VSGLRKIAYRRDQRCAAVVAAAWLWGADENAGEQMRVVLPGKVIFLSSLSG